MKRKNLSRAVAVTLAGASLGLIAPAAEAATIVGCGTVINAPGTWKLKADVACPSGTNFVNVNVDNVTVDLGGKTVTLQGVVDTGGVIAATNADNLRVKNGTITGDGTGEFAGVVAQTGTGHKISKVTFENLPNGVVFDVVTESVVEKSKFTAAAIAVFIAGGGGNEVKHNKITDAASNAVYVEGSSEANRIADNDIVGGGDTGAPGPGAIEITDTSDNNVIEDNEISDFTGNGIYLASGSGNEVEDNEIEDVTRTGIRDDSGGNLIEDNEVEGSGLDGMLINGNGSVAEDNKSEENGDDGIRVNGNGNTIEDNKANENGDGDSADEDGFHVTGTDNVLIDNQADDNNRDGFRVQGGNNANSEGNEADDNGVNDPAGVDCNTPVNFACNA